MPELRQVVIRHEVTLRAPAPRVWTSLTERIDGWWVEPLRAPDCRAVQLDLRIGGMLWEDLGSGSGRRHGTIDEIRYGSLVVIDGTACLPGALAGQLRFELAAGGDGSALVVTQLAVGALADDAVEARRAGWAHVLDDRLRRQVDGSPVDER